MEKSNESNISSHEFHFFSGKVKKGLINFEVNMSFNDEE